MLRVVVVRRLELLVARPLARAVVWPRPVDVVDLRRADVLLPRVRRVAVRLRALPPLRELLTLLAIWCSLKVTMNLNPVLALH